MDEITVPSKAVGTEVLESLALEVHELRQYLLASESELMPRLEAVHPDNLPSARNLVHYLALRQYDIRNLQMRLARVGLSSLGRSEPHVLVTLDRILALLSLARGTTPADDEPLPPVGFRHGERILAENARRVLGPPHPHRNVRIVVTLPAEAASDARLARDLVAAGMDCARINCARDDPATWAAMAENVRAAERVHDRECRILVDLSGPKLRTGAIPTGKKRLRLSVGDRFELVASNRKRRRWKALPRITCQTPEIFEDVRPGQPIWFDDGKIGGIIEERIANGLRIRVTDAKRKGSKLRPDRGINLPETELSLPGLGPKDLEDLAEVVAWADAIELSFAQREQDVHALQSALQQHGADNLAIILKIETRRGFENLPHLLLALMRTRSCGVMIARGDLAIETGFERMAEVQEEILWIAEAAHLPTIWATQVLENLAKKRSLTRAEVTDAAMSGRAEAVMLNKGLYVVDAIRTLDDILGRMQEHQSKKRSLFRALDVSATLWE